MANLFCQVDCLNGNINVIFEENSKRRHIIFKKGSDALSDYKRLCLQELPDNTSADDYYKGIIKRLQKNYVFKRNPNNVSIFTPKPKK